jgi:hypothetical protein
MGCENSLLDDMSVKGPDYYQENLSVLTYNVAGLPDLLSSSNPAQNNVLISPLLNTYDLVLVQEDFSYHEDLSLHTTHPYASEPMTESETGMHDGLSRFSQYLFDSLARVRWVACHGLLTGASDCLADKGFSMASTHLKNGLMVDVYNLHAEAGGGPADRSARALGFAQLSEYINEYSLSRAVIVAGDTNLKAKSDDDLLVFNEFLESTGLQDACRWLDCPVDHIDRVLFRGDDLVDLIPTYWGVASEFVNEAGLPLSDHSAIHVAFSYGPLR